MNRVCLISKILIYIMVAVIIYVLAKVVNVGSNLITPIVATITLIAALIEYNEHQNRSEAQTLSYFNERYSNDINIRRVIKWCLYNMPGENEEIIRPQNYNIDDMLYEKEMFMRFFEELEISLEKNNLTDEQAVFNTFAYYALRVSRFRDFVRKYEFHKKGDFLYIECNNEDWKYFEKFIQRMSKYEKK